MMADRRPVLADQPGDDHQMRLGPVRHLFDRAGEGAGCHRPGHAGDELRLAAGAQLGPVVLYAAELGRLERLHRRAKVGGGEPGLVAAPGEGGLKVG